MVKEELSKSGGSIDEGKDTGGRPSTNRGMHEGGMANQRRGDMRMYNKTFEMVRGTGHAGVAGVDLARAMPGALASRLLMDWQAARCSQSRG